MKKPAIIIAIAFAAALASCNSAHNKTGGESRDSAASHGNGGAADTAKSAAAGVAGVATSDSSHSGKSTAAPTVDSGKHN